MLGFSTFGGAPFAATGGSAPQIDLSDTFAATGTFTPDVLANLVERLNATGSIQMSTTLVGNAADGVSFLDSVMSAWQLLLAENIATAGDAVGSVQKLAALIDALAATGQASSQLSAFAACTAAMALEGLLAQGFTVAAADQMILADTSAAIARMLGPLVDGLAMSDTGTPMMRVSCISADSLALDADLSVILSANVDLADGLLFYVSLRLGDTDYTGWALNTTSQGASEYRNWPFDSMATAFRTKHYAAGPNGIARIGGDTDDGAQIDAWLRTTLTHFGTDKWKRVPDAYVGTADGALVLKVITRNPSTGLKEEDWYAVTRKQELGPGNGRVQIGRGLKSTWWQFELHNKAGSDFDLDTLKLRPLILDRRT